jgi:hypothetical protein
MVFDTIEGIRAVAGALLSISAHCSSSDRTSPSGFVHAAIDTNEDQAAMIQTRVVHREFKFIWILIVEMSIEKNVSMDAEVLVAL